MTRIYAVLEDKNMKKSFIFGTCILLLGVFLGCETVKGVTKDVANTARNIRDIIGVGRDIEGLTK